MRGDSGDHLSGGRRGSNEYSAAHPQGHEVDAGDDKNGGHGELRATAGARAKGENEHGAREWLGPIGEARGAHQEHDDGDEGVGEATTAANRAKKGGGRGGMGRPDSRRPWRLGDDGLHGETWTSAAILPDRLAQQEVAAGHVGARRRRRLAHGREGTDEGEESNGDLGFQ